MSPQDIEQTKGGDGAPAVTILQVALARGVKEDERGAVNGSEFARVGLPMMGGCEICAASIACYNASPSLSGFLRCSRGCIGDDGFATVEAFEAWLQGQDAEERRGTRGLSEGERYYNDGDDLTVGERGAW